MPPSSLRLYDLSMAPAMRVLRAIDLAHVQMGWQKRVLDPAKSAGPTLKLFVFFLNSKQQKIFLKIPSAGRAELMTSASHL